MANTVTKKRISSSLKTMLVENDATTLDGSTYVAIIDVVDVEAYERASIQMLANDGEGLRAFKYAQYLRFFTKVVVKPDVEEVFLDEKKDTRKSTFNKS